MEEKIMNNQSENENRKYEENDSRNQAAAEYNDNDTEKTIRETEGYRMRTSEENIMQENENGGMPDRTESESVQKAESSQVQYQPEDNGNNQYQTAAGYTAEDNYDQYGAAENARYQQETPESQAAAGSYGQYQPGENIYGQHQSNGNGYGQYQSNENGYGRYQSNENGYGQYQSQSSGNEYGRCQSNENGYGQYQTNENGYSQYQYAQPQPAAPSKKEKKAKKKNGSHGFGRKIAVMGLCCALIGGAVGGAAVYGISALTGGSVGSSGESTTVLTGSRDVAVSTSSVDTSEELTAAEVYEQNVNSTVGITTTVTTNYFGYETTSAASGSGFIITSDGYVVTNYHVIEDSSEITVSTYDGTSYDAELIGYDENHDVAVLKIDAEDLTPVVLGDSDQMSVGDSVVAIGNPLGELTFSLTAGTISALDRSVTLSTDVTMNLIQTDCAINSGNSGGALFNMYGEVIGITNAKYSSSSDSSTASIDNIAFAIPINQVKDIVTSIMESGTFETSFIGVSVYDATVNITSGSGVTTAAVVQSVTEGSPAEDAGIEAGDVITQVDDTEITSSSTLVSVVQSASAGDELVFTIYRDGEEMELTVTVGTQTKSALPDSEESTETDSDTESGINGSDSYGYSYGYGDMFGSDGSNGSTPNSGSGSDGSANSDGTL